MIETPFGKLYLFDAHAHFLSHRFLENLASLGGRSDAHAVCDELEWHLPPVDPVDLGQQWDKTLREQGVDRCVMFHTAPDVLASVAAAARSFPERIVAYQMINPVEPAADEAVARAVDESGVAGITMFPAMHGFDLGSDAVRRVLQVADEHHLVVFVHCGVLKVGFRKKLGLPCLFDATKGDPLALQPLAAEFGRVRWVLPHLGSGCLRQLLMLADTCENVYTDTSGIAGWSRYLPGPDGGLSPDDALKQVLEVMGPQRVLFGSDSSYFPRSWRRDVFDQQMEIFGRVGLGPQEAAMILGGNLKSILAGSAAQYDV